MATDQMSSRNKVQCRDTYAGSRRNSILNLILLKWNSYTIITFRRQKSAVMSSKFPSHSHRCWPWQRDVTICITNTSSAAQTSQEEQLEPLPKFSIHPEVNERIITRVTCREYLKGDPDVSKIFHVDEYFGVFICSQLQSM